MHFLTKIRQMSTFSFRSARALSVDTGLLVLRIGVALFMLPHGWQKLQHFLAGNHDFPDPIGLGPIVAQALAIFAEFFCSILLLMGLFIRPALLVLMGLTLIIAFVIHGSDPLKDKEHALLYFVAYLALFLTGPGRYALDGRR